MLVASLDGTVSVISTVDDTVTHTITLPPGANPAAAAYVEYSSLSRQIYVTDSANARVLVFRVSDLEFVGTLPTDADAFHMWLSEEQLWVVDRTARSAVVFDIFSQQRLATLPIPGDLLQAGGIPHDISADDSHAYISVLALDGVPDVIVKYDRSTFQEVGRVNVGEAPHVALNPVNREMYAACDATNNVFVINRDTMQVQATIPATGAHGTWVPNHGETFYTTNFPGNSDGGSVPGLIAINLITNQLLGSAPPLLPGPHNVFGTGDGSKAYVTHTNGGTTVSVYTIASPTAVPQLSGQVKVGTNPFGLTFFPGS
jgi:DNA-binding beta-propeller fold protein YncE